MASGGGVKANLVQSQESIGEGVDPVDRSSVERALVFLFEDASPKIPECRIENHTGLRG